MITEKPYHPTTLAHKVLMFLANQDGKWATWGPSFYMPSVQAVMPVGTTPKIQRRYMRMLQYKGLVGGCDCGCRGDYAPTMKGLEFLAKDCLIGEQELLRWKKENFMLGY